MRSQHLFLAFLMGLGLALLTLVALTGPQAQAAPEATCNRYVVGGGSNSSACSDSLHPCKTVQYALGRAASGDVICVADDTGAPGPSVYVGTIVITKSVTLDGAWQATFAIGGGIWGFASVPCNPAGVVLDAQGAGRGGSSASPAPSRPGFSVSPSPAATGAR